MGTHLLLPTLLLLVPLPSSSTRIQAATSLREYILDGYDKAIPPLIESEASHAMGNSTAPEVFMQIRFYKIESVEAMNGRMRLKVVVRMRWHDPRLRWTESRVEEWSNISTLFFHAVAATDPEGTEIWVPDVNLYNAHTGLDTALDPALATVSRDGTVFWSRPGYMDILCKFSGLVAFPLDELSCSAEVGGWAMSDEYQRILPLGSGWVWSDQEATSGSSYQEYTIRDVRPQPLVYYYNHPSGLQWSVIRYDIILGRATLHHLLLVVLPGFIFTSLALAVFFISPHANDRISFIVTLILANEVHKVVVTSYIPVCGELLWIEIFTLLSMLFMILAVAESAVVIFLIHHDEDSIIPPWILTTMSGYKYLVSWALSRCVPCWGSPQPLNDQGTIQRPESASGILYRQMVMRNGGEGTASPSLDASSRSSRLSIVQAGGRQPRTTGEEQSNNTAEKVQQATSTAGARTQRLIYFEHLFNRLDTEALGFVTTAEMDHFLSFIRLDLERAQRLKDIAFADSKSTDGKLDHAEFLDFCVISLWNVTESDIEMAVENYTARKSLHRRGNATRWRRLAISLDRHCRVIMPPLYCSLCLALVFVDVRDDYVNSQGVPTQTPMYIGFPPHAGWHGWSIVGALLLPAVVAVFVLSFVLVNAYLLRSNVLKPEDVPGWIRATSAKLNMSARSSAPTRTEPACRKSSPGEHPHHIRRRSVTRSLENVLADLAVSDVQQANPEDPFEDAVEHVITPQEPDDIDDDSRRV